MAHARPELYLHVAGSPAHHVAAALTRRGQELATTLAGVAAASDAVAEAAAIIVDTLSGGSLVLACGNGGSAAEAQHLVGELVGRFRRERDAWPALALTADAAVVTAIANDYGFETVFARQVAAFGRPGDVLVAFSTSGSSANVVNAAAAARERGLRVVALTGQTPSPLGALADAEIAVPAAETALVQEVYAVLVHLLCEIVESHLTALPAPNERTSQP
jgi:D-sedoheptulose 7-phosphate isomerase